MKKGKAIFVTVLVVGLLAAVDACMYVLFIPGFMLLTGAVAAYSFGRGAVDFCNWLRETDPVPVSECPAAVVPAEEDPLSPEAAAIVRELNKDL